MTTIILFKCLLSFDSFVAIGGSSRFGSNWKYFSCPRVKRQLSGVCVSQLTHNVPSNTFYQGGKSSSTLHGGPSLPHEVSSALAQQQPASHGQPARCIQGPVAMATESTPLRAECLLSSRSQEQPASSPAAMPVNRRYPPPPPLPSHPAHAQTHTGGGALHSPPPPHPPIRPTNLSDVFLPANPTLCPSFSLPLPLNLPLRVKTTTNKAVWFLLFLVMASGGLSLSGVRDASRPGQWTVQMCAAAAPSIRVFFGGRIALFVCLLH